MFASFGGKNHNPSTVVPVDPEYRFIGTATAIFIDIGEHHEPTLPLKAIETLVSVVAGADYYLYAAHNRLVPGQVEMTHHVVDACANSTAAGDAAKARDRDCEQDQGYCQ
jgi:hypothetical protein